MSVRRNHFIHVVIKVFFIYIYLVTISCDVCSIEMTKKCREKINTWLNRYIGCDPVKQRRGERDEQMEQRGVGHGVLCHR